MSKRSKLELKMLIAVLAIINRFCIRYGLRIHQTTPKVNGGNINKVRALEQHSLLDEIDKYWTLSLADFLEIHRIIKENPCCLDHLDHNLVFTSERVFRVDERNSKNPTIHFICLERGKENGPWMTKVLPKTFIDANRDKYKAACISR